MRATSVLASTAVILLSCISQAGSTSSTSPNPRPSRAPYLWPGGVIPFIVDPDVPRPERIYKAMAQWSGATPIRMVPRSTQKNYVRFVRQNSGGLCFSSIGMLGGEQRVKTDDRCSTGTLTHELGHTLGLWHQQSRPDRDRYVHVLYENIRETSARDFDVQMSDEPSIRPYDYGSIMHYGPYADSEESRGKTIETIPPGIPIGQRERVSPGDADAVTRMYGITPHGVTVTTFSPGLKIVVDGETYTAPQTFDWKPGTSHTIEAPDGQLLGNIRYKFGRWNDDGAAAHTIVASHDLTVYAANFVRIGQVTTIVRLSVPKPTPTEN